MRTTSLLAPGGALALAAVLLTPTESVGFTTIGGSLSQSQRDVRVYDNFTDASANNNTVEDAEFPGYTGAELAIWKASVEWGSTLHGPTGSGDPHQPGDLGSGGANFDVSWQGNATGTGNTNQNIHSEISGSSGGVLAYCETPISDGWRIRYYQSWTWQDGPGTAVGGGSNIDMQGVACHEYGHALGLGHSSTGGATMFPSISGSGVSARSIEADDIAGVQFIYGSASGSKPVISNVTGGSVLTISGSNFAGSSNEVWFTQAGQGGNGVPIKVTGLSSNGSTITVTIPGSAGPGDLLVKKGGSNGNAGLSNSWPYDPPPPCNTIVNYGIGGTTTNFCNATMVSSGTPSGSAGSGFTLTCANMEGQKTGLIFYGINGRRNTPWGSSSSTLLVAPPTQRTPAGNSGGTAGSCNGAISIDWNAYVQQPGKLGVPFSSGSIVNAQCWYRDPPSIETTHLSDAIEFVVCP